MEALTPRAEQIVDVAIKLHPEVTATLKVWIVEEK